MLLFSNLNRMRLPEPETSTPPQTDISQLYAKPESPIRCSNYHAFLQRLRQMWLHFLKQKQVLHPEPDSNVFTETGPNTFQMRPIAPDRCTMTECPDVIQTRCTDDECPNCHARCAPYASDAPDARQKQIAPDASSVRVMVHAAKPDARQNKLVHNARQNQNQMRVPEISRARCSMPLLQLQRVPATHEPEPDSIHTPDAPRREPDCA